MEKLKGYKDLVKYKSIRLWIVISNLTQKITYQYPKIIFQLFAI